MVKNNVRVHAAVILQHQVSPQSKTLGGGGSMNAVLRDVALHMFRDVVNKKKQASSTVETTTSSERKQRMPPPV